VSFDTLAFGSRVVRYVGVGPSVSSRSLTRWRWALRDVASFDASALGSLRLRVNDRLGLGSWALWAFVSFFVSFHASARAFVSFDFRWRTHFLLVFRRVGIGPPSPSAGCRCCRDHGLTLELPRSTVDHFKLRFNLLTIEMCLAGNSLVDTQTRWTQIYKKKNLCEQCKSSISFLIRPRCTTID